MLCRLRLPTVDADSEQRVGALHPDAVEQETVAQRYAGAVDGRPGAQEVCGDGNGKNLNVHVRCHSHDGDLVVRQQEVRVRRVGQNGQRGDIVDCSR